MRSKTEHIKDYVIIKSIGTFADELAFKRKYMTRLKKIRSDVKTVLAIENSVEPGMPDLLIVSDLQQALFIETKYAKNGVITFKKSQIPWYRRHKGLCIAIAAYNDKTKNIHLINANIFAAHCDSLHFRLRDEAECLTGEHL